jgi:hypothetical protein
MALTVGQVRKAIEGLPDDAPVIPEWAYGPPGDSDPAVSVCGFRRGEEDGTPGLAVLVDIVYLDDPSWEDRDADDEDLGLDDDVDDDELLDVGPDDEDDDEDEGDAEDDEDADGDLTETDDEDED